LFRATITSGLSAAYFFLAVSHRASLSSWLSVTAIELGLCVTAAVAFTAFAAASMPGHADEDWTFISL